MNEKLPVATVPGGSITSNFRGLRGGFLLMLLSGVVGSFSSAEGKTFIGKEISDSNSPTSFHIAAKEVTGVVTDESGEPLPGVSILEKGTTNGTVTDLDGKFSINVASNESILVFSFIGMASQDVPVGSQSTLKIEMASDTESLEEFVVIGYGSQKKREITSSVANVGEEDFVQGGMRSPMELIQGKVAGLNINRTQGSNPNGSTDIQLRGLTSIVGTTSPLIVIDGIPGGSLDLLQQDDIESFDVLKDGSAAAIYGTRGNAGVILITTKKGKS
ncbi:carboxypeptidase-like regulatory domain-containing protein [Echinicola sp. 20G]|uniref:carboxypeptidase-like regulatory domain-containing protein n=1 Tax=Echinicola sp. 20G TaxID=2781961 RepID=UPI001F3055E2|nr:carboxypeptidase-like regulatory domain-containing protein [Echinicola sp. 20G]